MNKSLFVSLRIPAGWLAGLTVVALAGCAASPGDTSGREGAEPAASATVTATAGSSAAQGATMGASGACPMMGAAGCAAPLGPGDKRAMCAMVRSMGEAPNEQARQAMLERHMPGTSPEWRRQHMEMMRRQCP